VRVKLRTTMCGPEFSGGAGDTLEVPRKLGDDLVLGGYAELVDEGPREEAPKFETAQAPDAPEAAVEPRPRKGKR
jgi:hypothetical protein